MTAQTLAPPRSVVVSTRRRPAASMPETKPAWLFLAPFALFYIAFLLWPVIYMFIGSLFNTSIVKPGFGSFAGFGNYREMFAKQEFRESLWHTAYFTLLTTIPLVVLAFVFAVLANRVKRGQGFFRLAFFVPYILPSASIALIWAFIYTPATGLLPLIQTKLGSLAPLPVLATPNLAMIGIAITTIWWTIGFNFIIYLAGLQDIPRELYEAAATDGASPFQQIRNITLPLLSRTTGLVVLLQIIASLKIFDQVYLMTSGGPGTKTQVALGFIANTSFTDFRVGAASAASVIFFVLILIIGGIYQLYDRRQNRTA